MARMGRKRKVADGLEDRVVYNHGAYYYIHPGDRNAGVKPRWERLGTDREAANKIGHRYNNPGERTGTMIYWLDQFLADCRRRVELKTAGKGVKLSPRTYADYATDIGTDEKPGPLRVFFTPAAGASWMTPADVTPGVVQAYLQAGMEANRATRANRERATLSACFGWLLRGDLCLGLRVNPCLRASGVRRNPEKDRERYVWDDEYRDVLAVATRAERLMMELCFRTLQRPDSDIIRWDTSIVRQRPAGRMLEFVQNKTRMRMTIAFSQELEQLVPRPPAGVAQLHVPIVAKEDGGFYTYDGLSGMLRRSIGKANAKRAAEGKSAIPSFGFRDCAAKGATDMWRAGTAIETIQALKGHKNKSTTERYVKARWQEAVQPNALKIGT